MSSTLKPYSSGRSYSPNKEGILDFLFIHIPRTGGTSIRRVLESYSYMGSEGGHLVATSEQFMPYIGKRFSFCIVRNPWDRLVSAYHLYKKEGQSFVEPFKTFKDFAMNLHDVELPEHSVPQIESICDSMGQLAVDFVGKFEHLQEDFDSICQIIGISPERLPTLNPSDHQPYWEYYDDESEEKVFKLFQVDIDFFGYTFGPSNKNTERVDKSNIINWSPLIKPPEEFNPLQEAPPERSWQCQEPRCGKITMKPYRWVVGAKTTFTCDTCSGKVKEINVSETEIILEGLLRKMALLEKHIMALHQRMDDQCGKP